MEELPKTYHCCLSRPITCCLKLGICTHWKSHIMVINFDFDVLLYKHAYRASENHQSWSQYWEKSWNFCPNQATGLQPKSMETQGTPTLGSLSTWTILGTLQAVGAQQALGYWQHKYAGNFAGSGSTAQHCGENSLSAGGGDGCWNGVNQTKGSPGWLKNAKCKMLCHVISAKCSFTVQYTCSSYYIECRNPIPTISSQSTTSCPQTSHSDLYPSIIEKPHLSMRWLLGIKEMVMLRRMK